MKTSRIKTRWIYPHSMILEIDFSKIRKVWQDKLWIGRTELDESSAMVYLDYDSYNMDNLKLPVHFFGVFVDGSLKGVNSVHVCADESMRSRGLWVNEDCRGRGFGKNLLQVAIDKAIEYNCPFIWSFPRKLSWSTYESVGFKLTSGWQECETNIENAYCRMDLK